MCEFRMDRGKNMKIVENVRYVILICVVEGFCVTSSVERARARKVKKIGFQCLTLAGDLSPAFTPSHTMLQQVISVC